MATESETLKKDIQDLRESLEKLSKDVSTISQSMADDVKSRAARATEKARENVKNVASEVSAKSRESAEAVENTVRERPFQSLLVAFGAGVLLSQLIRKH